MPSQHYPDYEIVPVEGAYIRYRLGPARTCEIVDLFVPEDSRRNQIGTSLVFAVFNAMARPYNFYVFTRRTNGVARLFYEKLGFRGYPVPEFYLESLPDCDAILYVQRKF